MRRALAFLTPLGGAAEPDTATLGWFPLAGALVGAGVGAVWWVGGELWSPVVAAALAVAADLALTGLLHFDGLVDSADGLLPQVDRRRRLAIMAEPAVGAYGTAVGGAVLLLRFATLAAVAPDVLVLAGTWSASRTVMAVGARALPYARAEGGLASDLLGNRWRWVAVHGACLAVLLGALGGGLQPASAVLVAFVVGALVLVLARRRLGGFTGDVLGAAGMLAETAALLALAVEP